MLNMVLSVECRGGLSSGVITLLGIHLTLPCLYDSILWVW